MFSQLKLSPINILIGSPQLAPDKSLTHRALLLAALPQGGSIISNPLVARDTKATMRALTQMGCKVSLQATANSEQLIVTSPGWRDLKSPGVVDCANSGTSMRLLLGLLAGLRLPATLIGDDSLTRRPMLRVIEPLQAMGAKIGHCNGNAPLEIFGNHPLVACGYQLPVASAQVKSSLMLAGLFTKEPLVLSGRLDSRDHTERLFSFLNLPFQKKSDQLVIGQLEKVPPFSVEIPNDISSAAFFIVAGLLQSGEPLELPNVGINPSRMGLIEVLRAMGATFELKNIRQWGEEPVANIRVIPSRLHATKVGASLVPSLIDEVPVLAIAMAASEGTSVIQGLNELRMKESDRLAGIVEALVALGIDAAVVNDDLVIKGGMIQGGVVDAKHDHRLAMAFSVASLRAKSELVLKNSDVVDVSFPAFWDDAKRLGFKVTI